MRGDDRLVKRHCRPLTPPRISMIDFEGTRRAQLGIEDGSEGIDPEDVVKVWLSCTESDEEYTVWPSGDWIF